MNNQQLSNEFDVLYDNVMSNAAPGLTEYEKSVFLTNAQEELVKNYFTAKGNKYGEGIGDSIKRETDFSFLIKGSTIQPTDQSSYQGIDSRSTICILPEKTLFILNEIVQITYGGVTTKTIVVPISPEEYTRLMSKPFKEPLKGQTWRFMGYDNTNMIVELIPKSEATITNYYLRYVRYPDPIILTDLSSYGAAVNINGISIATPCQMVDSLQREILGRAVEMAKVAYSGDVTAIIQTNTRNE